MTWVVPPALEDAVLAAAREVVGDAALGTAALTRAIIDRSRRYTSDRDRLATPPDKRADLAARAAFFTIADAIKVAIPLSELRNRGALPARVPLRVLDLGAGCGALSLGLASQVTSALEITAIDRDADALAIAQRAMARFGTAAFEARTGDLARHVLPAADLVLVGTVLNELPATARIPLVERALSALAPDGALIIIEPALRDLTRALHELRDVVLARGLARVFAPCTRGGGCPALADPDDWCHEDRAVKLPPRTAELARLTHLRDDGLKFSYLVLRKDGLGLVDVPGAWRVVSATHSPKGKLELIGCGEAGRVPIRLLRRHRAESNRPIERARRGDVLVIDRAPGPDRLEVEAVTRVDRIEPATA